jgi:hypothetical protein
MAKGSGLSMAINRLRADSALERPPRGFANAGIVGALFLAGLSVAATGQPQRASPVRPPLRAPAPVPASAPPGDSDSDGFGTQWGRIAVQPGGPVDARPAPPKAGHKRCIGVDNIAGTQVFGDSAIELTMKTGHRFRMFFARECPALSFYQGFYYRRQKAGQLCAGRDSVGARSGGECRIASIIQVRRFDR